MITVAANEAKQFFCNILNQAQREPVLVQKHQRSVAVILSSQEYDRLRGINVAEFPSFYDRVGAKAKKTGLTEKRLVQLLHG
jgi:antitoxin Phd